MTTIPPDDPAAGQPGHILAHGQISDALTAHDEQLGGLPAMSWGTVTLTAGTVNVSAGAVTADSVILVSRMALSGTAGHLSVPSQSPGSGFTISSSSSSDASVVAYLILG
jgi:hypothetical protein